MKGFHSRAAKQEEVVPAQMDGKLFAKLSDAAKKAHVALGCQDYSLYDFRVDDKGEVYCLEGSLYCSFAPNSKIVDCDLVIRFNSFHINSRSITLSHLQAVVP